MKTFAIRSDTNYGIMVHIVNAETKEEAHDLAIEAGAWNKGDSNVEEVDVKKYGVIYEAAP